MEIYKIRDPIYGFIEFNEWEKEIIAHPAFQRLRRIRQLGLTEMVYPGATHTRFEHSLGVMHLITRMYDAIVQKEDNKRILRDNLAYDEAGFHRDRQIVRLAGLLHDVGHAPFSHASEKLMGKKPDSEKKLKHEDYTVSIINGPLKNVIENHSLNNNYGIQSEHVADMITGNPKLLKGRVFWKVLISSQLDADRGDYLLRDSLHVGVKYGIYDLERLLVTLGLGIDPETKDVVLGVEKGGWHVAEALILARYQMFTQVYHHKTRRAYDYLLQEGLSKAIEHFPSPNEWEEYQNFDDFFAWSLMKEKAKDIIERIICRDHPRILCESPDYIKTTEEEENRRAKVEQLKEKLRKNNIWFWEDTPEETSSWYKLDSEEIKIINKDYNSGVLYLLSQYSSIVKALRKKISMMRIYVNASDREKANEIGGL